MPRKGMTLREKTRHEEVYKRYGGQLNQKDVGAVIGLRHHKSIEKFVAGLPFTIINGRKTWKTVDVVKRLEENTIYPI